MNLPKMTARQIAFAVLCALDHTRDDAEGENPEYVSGGLETSGHLLSCLMVQAGGLDSMETTEGVRLVQDRPSLEVLAERVTEYARGGAKRGESNQTLMRRLAKGRAHVALGRKVLFVGTSAEVEAYYDTVFDPHNPEHRRLTKVTY